MHNLLNNYVKTNGINCSDITANELLSEEREAKRFGETPKRGAIKLPNTADFVPSASPLVIIFVRACSIDTADEATVNAIFPASSASFSLLSLSSWPNCAVTSATRQLLLSHNFGRVILTFAA